MLRALASRPRRYLAQYGGELDKVIPSLPDGAEEPEIVRRFQREARAAARVNHPNLTHVYFVGTDETARFFVMVSVVGTTDGAGSTDPGGTVVTSGAVVDGAVVAGAVVGGVLF